MKEVDIVSKIVNREGGTFVPSSKGTQPIDLSDYLLKSIWDKVWEIRTDSQGTEYVFGKLPVVTQSGITMYSGDGVDIPSLASGLPFDGRTIWYNSDTQQIEVIGGTGGGSGEGVSNFWDLSGIPSWITISKPKYTYTEIEGTPDLSVYALKTQIPSLSGYATESWVTQQNYATKATTLSGYGITDAYTKTNVDDLLKSYVTLGGRQTITGEKNFVGGLKINGSPIYYDTEKKYWKLEGDLLVTGGVTMYGSDSSFTPSTIMDAIVVDGTTISKSGGVLKVIGGTGGGVADSVAWANITGKPTWIGSSKPIYSYSEITGAISTTELQNYLTSNSYLNVTSGDNRYLQLSGGTISNDGYALILNRASDNPVWLQFRMQNEFVGAIGGENGALRFMDKNSIVNTVWHSGNDGSGSGLDADLLDGVHLMGKGGTHGIMRSWARGTYTTSKQYFGNGNVVVIDPKPTDDSSLWANTTIFSVGEMEIRSHQLAFGYDEDRILYRRVDDGPRYNSWRTIAFTDSNVASATKLQTARTIWGQSFDGTGNVDGSLTINKATTSSGDYGACVLINGTYAETGFHRALSYENQKMALGSQAAVYIGAKNNQYNGGFIGFKYVASNSPSNYMAIGLYAANDLFCVLGNGNIGVGTTSPSYKLDVNGTIKFASKTLWGQSFDGTGNVSGVLSGVDGITFNSYNAVSVDYNSNFVFKQPNTTALQDWSIQKNDTTKIFIVRNDGNVGIGKTNLIAKLDVAGGISCDAVLCQWNNSTSFNVANMLNPGYAWYGSTKSHLYPNNGTQATMCWKSVLSNGYETAYSIGTFHPTNSYGYMILTVGHGTTRDCFLEIQASGVVSVSGNFLAQGGITMYSDQRKKTILNHVELSLKQIADAPLIEHYYNSDDKKTTHVGSIAQYWASMNDWFCKLDSEGYYTMEIQNAALASAISIARELDRYETKTDKAIKKLKKRICELEEEIERFKSA